MPGRDHHHLRFSPAGIGLRSALLPGWGQYVSGRRRRAIWMLQVVIVSSSAAVAAVLLGPARMAGWLVRPQVMVGLIAANLVFLAFRAFSVWDAWKGAGGTALAPSLVALLTFVAAPHAAAAYYQVQTYRLLTKVFASSPTTTSAPRAAMVTVTGGVVLTVTTEVPSTTTTTVPFQGRHRLTFLLLGGDAGLYRTAIRTDSVIVATVDLNDGDLALFGLPRNLSGLSFPDGTPFTARLGILNEVYIYGLDRPDLFPGPHPGAAAITQIAEQITGLPIDYFVLVNLEAFVEIVDALGGITMSIPVDLRDDAYPKEDGSTVRIFISAGIHHLSGSEALAYVRSRHQSSDYDRMSRQRCFLAALTREADVPHLLLALPGLISVIEENVLTDIPLDLLPDLVELTSRVKPEDALVVGFSPPRWNSGWTPEGYPIPDVEKMREAVALVVADPQSAIDAYEFGSAQTQCEPATIQP